MEIKVWKGMGSPTLAPHPMDPEEGCFSQTMQYKARDKKGTDVLQPPNLVTTGTERDN